MPWSYFPSPLIPIGSTRSLKQNSAVYLHHRDLAILMSSWMLDLVGRPPSPEFAPKLATVQKKVALCWFHMRGLFHKQLHGFAGLRHDG
jgi:hypothetical protein